MASKTDEVLDVTREIFDTTQLALVCGDKQPQTAAVVTYGTPS
jgi:hypothetical protein